MPKPRKKDATYEAFKKQQAEISRERSASGREIGPLPDVDSPPRRNACERDFRQFCETYLAGHFPLEWSEDHLKAIDRIQVTVLDGGLFAFAMPRGSGKTTLTTAGAIWSVCYGHRLFPVLVGATERHAESLCESIQVEFETNDLILADFPEIAYPIARLERIANRCKGQTLDGTPTRMTWTAKELIFPTVVGSKSSGIVIRVAGITGAIRGMKATTAEGKSIRPDLCLIDDPQTDESASSPTQNADRESILSGAILGLAGPGKKIAAVMPCTVIHPGDMADRILDRTAHPEWHGERTKLIYAMPQDQDKWDEYARIRRESLRNGGSGKEATDFYLANREAMDAGAKPAWPARKNPDELSAIQHAMNLKIDRPATFDAEYQNDPKADANDVDLPKLDKDILTRKVSGLPWRVVPHECTRITAFIDVGATVLWWATTAWTEQYGGSIIEYGAWPRQTKNYFGAKDAVPNITTNREHLPEPARVYAAIQDLLTEICGREYEREQGGTLPIDRVLVDSGWQTDTVYKSCRESAHATIVIPSKGYAVNASGRSVGEWDRKPGEIVGWNWRIGRQTNNGRGRLCVFDPNSWKTFCLDRLIASPGSKTSVSLPGIKDESWRHFMLADHCVAEYRERKPAKGRYVDEWRMKPGLVDNHLWDCVVGCCVAASTIGIRWQAGLGIADNVTMPANQTKHTEKTITQKRQTRDARPFHIQPKPLAR